MDIHPLDGAPNRAVLVLDNFLEEAAVVGAALRHSNVLATVMAQSVAYSMVKDCGGNSMAYPKEVPLSAAKLSFIGRVLEIDAVQTENVHSFEHTTPMINTVRKSGYAGHWSTPFLVRRRRSFRF